MSNIAKILLAVNGVFLTSLADPTISALIAAHPKVAAVIAVASNVAHLVADAFNKK